MIKKFGAVMLIISTILVVVIYLDYNAGNILPPIFVVVALTTALFGIIALNIGFKRRKL